MPTLPFLNNPSPDPSLRLYDTADNQRTVWNIIWSCLVTIFACTWLAIHPNIPAASDSRLILALRRLGLMMCMLIIPEIIILWAMRQWYGARKIAKAHRAQRWTSTHGFFLQMGGFMLYSRGKALYPLQLQDLERLYENGEIDWPTITDEEIQDKSKGDALSKGIVILQTSWFLAQCIMRGIKGLVITELELVTLAFAALNTVTYFFWWNKPIDVRWPIAVHKKSDKATEGHLVINDSLDTSSSDLLYSIQDLFRGAFNWTVRLLHLRSPVEIIVHLHIPAAMCLRPFQWIIKTINGKGTRNSRVPTLHAIKASPDPDIFFFMSVASSAIGIFFGAIHCIAWSFQFPSPREQVLWRISSLVITCAPLLIVVLSVTISRQLRVGPFGGGASIQRGSLASDARDSFDSNRFNLQPSASFNVAVNPLIDDTRSSIDSSDLSPSPVTTSNRLSIATLYNNTNSSRLSNDLRSPVDTDRFDIPPPPAAATGLANNRSSETTLYNDDLNSLVTKAKVDNFYLVPSFPTAANLWSGASSPQSWDWLRRRVGAPLRWLLEPCRIRSHPDGKSTKLLFAVTWMVFQRLILLFTTLAYITARFTLLIQALMALRDISPSALEAVEWTSFLPHF